MRQSGKLARTFIKYMKHSVPVLCKLFKPGNKFKLVLIAITTQEAQIFVTILKQRWTQNNGYTTNRKI